MVSQDPRTPEPHINPASLLVDFKASDWTEDDVSFLSRLMVKFPGGTPGRWEKIAHELGRSVTDVSQSHLVLSGQDWTHSLSVC